MRDNAATYTSHSAGKKYTMDPSCQDSACAGGLRGASRSLQALRVPGDWSLATHPHFSNQLPFFSTTSRDDLKLLWFSNPGYLKRERRVFYNLKPQMLPVGVRNTPTLLLGKPWLGWGCSSLPPTLKQIHLCPFLSIALVLLQDGCLVFPPPQGTSPSTWERINLAQGFLAFSTCGPT